MKEFVISEVKAETAVLVGLITKTQDEAKTKEYLDELEFLADTAGAVTVKRFTQKVVSPNQTTYVGKGKLEEIKEYIKNEEEEDREVGMVIFDDELSAKQIRNIEQELQVKILDRTSLILDIFAMRAQTAAAKTQVELAQYRYMLPRLQRLWTHLERQGGGSGSGGGKGSVGLRGPGETQLEMDFAMKAMGLCITVILYGRMIEIYIYASVGPVPFATFMNREWGNIGTNYVRGLAALGLQGFLIMICVGIYAVLVNALSLGGDLHAAVWSCAAYTVLLCFSLFKTGSVAKSILNAH